MTRSRPVPYIRLSRPSCFASPSRFASTAASPVVAHRFRIVGLSFSISPHLLRLQRQRRIRRPPPATPSLCRPLHLHRAFTSRLRSPVFARRIQPRTPSPTKRQPIVKRAYIFDKSRRAPLPLSTRLDLRLSSHPLQHPPPSQCLRTNTSASPWPWHPV